MGIVTKYASGAYDPATMPRVPLSGYETQGNVRSLISTVEVANGDSSTSKLFFGAIPSNARILPQSRLDHDSIAGVTDFDLGGGKTAGGVYTQSDIDNLIDGANLTSAGNKALSGINIDSQNDALWQLLGYTDDPGGDLDIVGTLKADASGAGTATLNLLFALP